MSQESALWKTMHKALATYGHLDRVENRVGVGMPDVAYLLRRSPVAQAVAGWVELKYEPAWPRRAATPVVFKKLTLDQVTWLEDYATLGGRAYLLAQVGRDYLLLRTGTLRALYERRLSRLTLEHQALVFAADRFPAIGVLKCLT